MRREQGPKRPRATKNAALLSFAEGEEEAPSSKKSRGMSSSHDTADQVPEKVMTAPVAKLPPKQEPAAVHVAEESDEDEKPTVSNKALELQRKVEQMKAELKKLDAPAKEAKSKPQKQKLSAIEVTQSHTGNEAKVPDERQSPEINPQTQRLKQTTP